ncbi:MAG: hypothetical protein U1F43_32115 [Myxococcota bacterium]
MTRARARVAVVLALALGACASAGDVDRRGKALEARLDPVRKDHCPPEPLARGMAEIAFARSAAERGDPIAAKAHLDQAEVWAAAAEEAQATSCGAPPAEPPPVKPEPPVDAPPAPPDLDQDGVPDASDADDDGDGISDVVDQCPRAAEDLDGYEDIDGCPEPGGPDRGTGPNTAPVAPPRSP